MTDDIRPTEVQEPMTQAALDLVRMHAGAGDYLTPTEGQALISERDRLAREVERLKGSISQRLDNAYDEGWHEGYRGGAGAS